MGNELLSTDNKSSDSSAVLSVGQSSPNRKEMVGANL